jgi:hypothetical protein
LEDRLVPLNALIALLTGHGGWPAPFQDDGVELKWLEVPVRTSEGLVVIDVLAYSNKLDLLVPAEAKSGANADEDQARKYASLEVEPILRQVTVQGATVPNTRIEPIYACLKANADRILKGLGKAGLSCP